MGRNVKNSAYTKWAKMQKHSKKYHMFLKSSLFHMVGIIAFLILINDLLWNGFTRNVVLTAIIKIICAYLLGTVIGYYKWDYCKNLVEKNYKDLKEIKKQHIIIYGILSFGGTLVIALFNMFLDGEFRVIYVVFMILICLLAGYVWALLMWMVFGDKMKEYIQTKEQDSE